MKYIILIAIFFTFGCTDDEVLEERFFVVNGKTQFEDSFKLASTDGDDIDVTFGIYNNVEFGDTLVFNCFEGKTLHSWNCGYLGIRKGK